MVNYETNGKNWALIKDVVGEHRLDLDVLQKIEIDEGKLTLGGNPEVEFDLEKKVTHVFCINIEFKNGRTKRLSFELEEERKEVLSIIDEMIGTKEIFTPKVKAPHWQHEPFSSTPIKGNFIKDTTVGTVTEKTKDKEE